MEGEDKLKIWISIGEVKGMSLSIRRCDEEVFRKAADLVNQLWGKWKERFKDTISSEELMARIAFQFARLFVEASSRNDEVNKVLSEFEKELNEIVVKVQTDKNI